MKRFLKCLLIPAVVIAGMFVMGAGQAEAHRWRRPRVVVPHYHYGYYGPYWHPRVHVRAPAVRVDVAPWGRYWSYGGTVVAPGVRVDW